MREQDGGYPVTKTISNYCWHQNPTAAGRCVLNIGHQGPHYDWYTRPSWAGPGAEWPQKAPAR